MPTYDYVCTACGHEYELFQKMTDEPKKRCPKCRSRVERKIGSGAGLLFKGSGFYITDYRSDDYKKKVKSEGSSSSSASGDSNGSGGSGSSGSSSSKASSDTPSKGSSKSSRKKAAAD